MTNAALPIAALRASFLEVVDRKPVVVRVPSEVVDTGLRKFGALVGDVVRMHAGGGKNLRVTLRERGGGAAERRA